MTMKILVIDDEQSQREILRDILADAGYQVLIAESGDTGLTLLMKSEFDIVLTDLKMPGKDGLEVLHGVHEQNPDIQVIIMTAFGTIPGAVNAIKSGAYDYLTKPFKKDELLRVVQRAADRVSLLKENRRLKSEISGQYRYQNIIGKSPGMNEMFRLIDRIKDVDATVLISGESGTGKELVAKAIHYNSKRSDGPFVALNCGAIPETLIESELFGHEKGSFTGANKSHTGKFEQAQCGTIFLDEIGTMRMDLQIRLLRVLQEKKIERVGATNSINLDVRILAATNEDLNKKVSENRFRADLFHRLNVFHIQIPPLRERREDITLLADHFIKKYAKQYNKPQLSLTKNALDKLEKYAFPGNVRELENLIEKAFILCDGHKIESEDLMISNQLNTKQSEREFSKSLPDVERQLIIEALDENRGALKPTARKLGISYKTLQYRLKKFELDKNNFK
jgi:DNA-binding NtrC family response regulator